MKFNSENPARVVLIEDNKGDAVRIEHLLRAYGSSFEFTHFTDITQFAEYNQDNECDVILLDIHLVEVTGVKTVRMVKKYSEDIPIVVMTGLDSDDTAEGCIDAGAQDYLIKDEVTTRSLAKSIDYAILRGRDRRDLKRAIRSYKRMATDASGTSVTASVSGVGPLRERDPDLFADLVDDYAQMLAPYLVQLLVDSDKPEVDMERLITRIGDSSGGPRDLIDIHLKALDMSSKNQSEERMRAYAVESRLLALEMMGLLVNYYRVGQRKLYKK